MKKHGWYRNKGKETPSREIYINKEGVETAGFLLFSHLGDGFQFSLCRAPNLMDVEMNGHVCAFIVVPGARTDPDSAGREDEMHEIKQYERKGSIICSVFFSWNWRRLKISTFIFSFCRGYNSKKRLRTHNRAIAISSQQRFWKVASDFYSPEVPLVQSNSQHLFIVKGDLSPSSASTFNLPQISA